MKLIRRFLLVLLIILIGVICFFIKGGNDMYKEAVNKVPLDKKIADIKSNTNYVTKDDVPDYYKNAIIAVEDHRFYKHGPIDLISIARAVVSNFQAKELNEGGSTITQQVAKNLYFIGETNYLYRKIAEVFIAYDLENAYSKDDILEFYYNTIYFGSGFYGISQASNGYYKKSPKDLNLDEATLLAGVPNAPSVYSPFVNPTLAKNRQGKVISSMVKYNYLSQEEADKLLE